MFPLIYSAINTITVDRYDCRFIALGKDGKNRSTEEFIDAAKQIWADRCFLRKEYVETEYMVAHFLPMIIELNPKNALTLVAMNDPKTSIWYDNTVPTYWDMLLINISSIFTCTETKWMLGYREWYDKMAA